MATITVTPVISVPVTSRTLSAIQCYDNNDAEPVVALAFTKTMTSLSGSVVFPYTHDTNEAGGPANQEFWTTG